MDRFPKTDINQKVSCHVEMVVLLSQQKPDDMIEIDLDLDELDATSAELKATYQEIKDYVLKEFGLKVSNLYISQVKRKCGIEVGENYNLPKSENARVPQCPKEKEEKLDVNLCFCSTASTGAAVYFLNFSFPFLLMTKKQPRAHPGRFRCRCPDKLKGSPHRLAALR